MLIKFNEHLMLIQFNEHLMLIQFNVTNKMHNLTHLFVPKLGAHVKLFISVRLKILQ